MSDMADNRISDEILSLADEYINELLKNKKLPTSVRAQLEIQSYFLMFLVQDHERINQMYPVYKQYRERQDRWEKFWDRFQWVIIPMAISGVLAFAGQFIYFWLVVVPKLVPIK
jgi:hypothetical protein